MHFGGEFYGAWHNFSFCLIRNKILYLHLFLRTSLINYSTYVGLKQHKVITYNIEDQKSHQAQMNMFLGTYYLRGLRGRISSCLLQLSVAAYILWFIVSTFYFLPLMPYCLFLPPPSLKFVFFHPKRTLKYWSQAAYPG